jgi:hypothetical protein
VDGSRVTLFRTLQEKTRWRPITTRTMAGLLTSPSIESVHSASISTQEPAVQIQLDARGSQDAVIARMHGAMHPRRRDIHRHEVASVATTRKLPDSDALRVPCAGGFAATRSVTSMRYDPSNVLTVLRSAIAPSAMAASDQPGPLALRSVVNSALVQTISTWAGRCRCRPASADWRIVPWSRSLSSGTPWQDVQGQTIGQCPQPASCLPST